jgi:hypothetical protein
VQNPWQVSIHVIFQVSSFALSSVAIWGMCVS